MAMKICLLLRQKLQLRCWVRVWRWISVGGGGGCSIQGVSGRKGWPPGATPLRQQPVNRINGLALGCHKNVSPFSPHFTWVGLFRQSSVPVQHKQVDNTSRLLPGQYE